MKLQLRRNCSQLYYLYFSADRPAHAPGADAHASRQNESLEAELACSHTLRKRDPLVFGERQRLELRPL
jgi:hypothetical protein